MRRTILLAVILAFSLAGRVQAQPAVEASGLFDNLFPRKTIDTSIMGVNAFCNDSRFGSVRAQLQEVKSTLRLNYVRVLFAWDDHVQPTPSSRVNFSFYDDIVAKLPRGVQALVILTGVPSWANDPQNWVQGSPRTTFVQRWVKKVVNRYDRKGQIRAYQIWNEPNDSGNANNALMGFVDHPENYVEMLRNASSHIRSKKRKKAVVNAATTAINQGYPRALDYNRGMIESGASDLVDVWAAHYYGTHYENVLRPGGVADFLNTITKPIWITESGEQGINQQREYVERTWPFLFEQIPGIKRFYLYQFTDSEGSETTYGLRNPTPGLGISDLYIYLRDRR